MPRYKEERVETKRIRKRLIDLDMTQRELAQKIGMRESYLGDILSGRKSGTKYAEKIYKVLGLERAG